MLKFVILQSIWRSTGVLGDCTGLLGVGGVMNVGEAGVFGIPSNCRAGGVGQLGFGVLESVGRSLMCSDYLSVPLMSLSLLANSLFSLVSIQTSDGEFLQV